MEEWPATSFFFNVRQTYSRCVFCLENTISAVSVVFSIYAVISAVSSKFDNETMILGASRTSTNERDDCFRSCNGSCCRLGHPLQGRYQVQCIHPSTVSINCQTFALNINPSNLSPVERFEPALSEKDVSRRMHMWHCAVEKSLNSVWNFPETRLILNKWC